MLKKTIFATLSIATFLFGLIYWWKNWAYSVFADDIVRTIIAVFVFIIILIVSYSFCYVSGIFAPPKIFTIRGIPISSILIYFFAGTGAFLNLYFSAIFVTSHLQGARHDFANWVYPMIPFLAFALFLILPLTPIVNRNNKKIVRNSWVAISLTFVFAEFVSLILP